MAAREGTGMQPLSAEIITEQLIGDQRSAVRRTLRLGVSSSYAGDVAMALILNLSEQGLLVETLVELAEEEVLQIEFPGANVFSARVIWTAGLLAGCEFVEPVSTAVVSAAQLRSSTEADENPASIEIQGGSDKAYDYDESSVQTVIIIVTSLISVLALMIFLAAVLPL
jgi:hypothetical protein